MRQGNGQIEAVFFLPDRRQNGIAKARQTRQWIIGREAGITARHDRVRQHAIAPIQDKPGAGIGLADLADEGGEFPDRDDGNHSPDKPAAALHRMNQIEEGLPVPAAPDRGRPLRVARHHPPVAAYLRIARQVELGHLGVIALAPRCDEGFQIRVDEGHGGDLADASQGAGEQAAERRAVVRIDLAFRDLPGDETGLVFGGPQMLFDPVDRVGKALVGVEAHQRQGVLAGEPDADTEHAADRHKHEERNRRRQCDRDREPPVPASRRRRLP